MKIDSNANVDAAALLNPDCVIERGAIVGPGVEVGAGAHIGPNVVCVAPDASDQAKPVCIRDGVRVGANATLYAGVLLGAGCVVRPGAVVMKSVPPGAIVEGHPAYIVGYVNAAFDSQAAGPGIAGPGKSRSALEPLDVKGVSLHRFPVIPDLRGNLSVGEFGKQIPFDPKRYFLVFDVPSREVRGEHAHYECHQFLICVRGNCSVVIDDGERRREVLLDAPNIGLYLPPLTWGIQYKYSADALLLVFASHHYDAADYIRDYSQYLAVARRHPAENRNG